MNGYEEADRLTDAELERLERELERIYREAAEDMQKEISDYFTSFAKREKQYRAMVEAGTMTEEEFTRWRLGAIGRGERMKALRDKLAERMTQANEEAAAMMNRAMLGIFVLNGNYTAYEIFGGEGIDWTLWNEEAVRRIIRDDPDLMPYYPAERAVRRGIDLDWGRRQITAQVISSILLGDGLGTIAEKLMGRIEGMNATSAKRTARTAVTEAQNAGRQSVFEMAAELGIKLHRRWVATKDLRTRHAHAMADHQIVAVNEPFTVGGEKIMFPGSGSLGASGWNLYNCRCTVVSSEKEGIEAEPRMMRVWDPVKGEWVLMEDVSYSQWYAAMKAKHGESAMEAALKMAKYRTSDREQYERYKAVLGKQAPGSFADFQDLKYKTPAEWEELKNRYRESRYKEQEKTVAMINGRGIINSRGMASGLRKPATHILTRTEIESLIRDAESIEIPIEILRFNEGRQTGFRDSNGLIYVRGDVLPDENGDSARDTMSSRAVLAHEYYGHFKNHPSEYPVGAWEDEFRASYNAAVYTPNLSAEERGLLMIDAYDREREAGTFNGYDETARRLLFGE